jgi:cell filamentation protein
VAFVDPYFDEHIGELRNLLGTTSAEDFHTLEPQIVFANELELESTGIPRTNNLEEVLLIHKQLFKGVYDWAGKIRTVDIFVKRLAHYYDQLNYIHPFREGNGRTQRVFWGRVAHDAGYAINWDAVIGNENDEASKLAAENMDLSGLEAMFGRIVSPL